jgi:hypothetical protein
MISIRAVSASRVAQFAEMNCDDTGIFQANFHLRRYSSELPTLHDAIILYKKKCI